MSAPFRLVTPRPIYEAVLAHARAELPAECCGLLAGIIAGDVGRVTMHLPLVNALASPTEYESEPRSMFAAHKAMRAAGTEVLAVYHSHPTGDPVPSRRDLDRSYDERVVHLIIGLRRAEPGVRGWWLAAGGAREAEFVVVNDGASEAASAAR
jgi:proteasome lid subunit RPN8/RPN11